MYISAQVCRSVYIYVAGKTYRRIIELKLNLLDLVDGKKVSANRFNLMVICTPTEERSSKKKAAEKKPKSNTFDD